MDSVYCITDPPDTVIAIKPETQLFGGDGITQISDDPVTKNSRAIFDPAAAGLGTHVVTYHIGAWSVRVTEPVPVNLNPYASVCEDGASFVLSGGSPAGGSYAVDGTDSVTTFNPAAFGAGTHFITYHYGPDGCKSISAPQPLTVRPLPDIVFNPLDDVCVNTPPFALTQASPPGGNYSGTGVSGNMFYPGLAGAGLHTITYTYSDGYCSNDASRNIMVGAMPTVSFSGLDSIYCDSDPKVLIMGYPTNSYGYFTGDGITNNGNGTAYFDPASSGLGYHQITFIYTNPNGCSESYTMQVRVGTLLTFSGLGSKYCADDPDVTFSYEPSGGTFSPVAGLNDNLNGTATLSPSTGVGGTRAVTYTYTDIYGCVNKLQKNVQINPVPNVNFTGLSSAGYCKNGDSVNIAGNNAPLGTFSGPGITDNGNGTAKFNPKELPVGGPYAVEYYYKDPVTGCDNSVSYDTKVLPLPSAVITGNQTICIGDMAGLTVDFTGTGPFSFTWSDSLTSVTVSNVNDPYTLNLSPTENSVISVSSVTQANGCSNTGSGQGYITVNQLSQITDQPEDQTACPGDNITFNVSASGIGLSYQWQKDGNPIPGETNSILMLDNVLPAAAGSYTCVVTSTCGPPLTSGPGVLTVLPETVITGQPSNINQCEGTEVHFNIQVAGSNLSYRWQKNGTDLADVGRFSGTDTKNLVISDVAYYDAGVYTCVITGDCGTVSSNPATLSVMKDVNIAVQPVSKSMCPGNNTSFNVSATGSNLTYQWQLDNVDIPGATSPTLILNAVSSADGGNYRCIVSGSCNSVSSNIASLTVYEPVNISLQPQDALACEGSSADFNITASGSNLGYQWKKDGVDLSDNGRINGSASPNLKINGLTLADGGGYICTITGNCGSVNSSTALLEVDSHLAITTQPLSQQVCAGDNVILSSLASGTNLVYQWYKDGTLLPGESSNSLMLSSVGTADEGKYYNTVTNACGSVSTNLASVGLNDETNIVTQPGNASICEGDNSNFKVVATGSNLSFQWLKNGLPQSDGGNLSGTQSSSLLINNAAVSDAGIFICQVSGSCGNLNTDPASLFVHETTVVTKQPLDKTACPGTNVSFEAGATGTNLSYQWQFNGSDISGETGKILLLPGVGSADEGLYRCRISGDCGVVFTNPATLTVNDAISLTSSPVNQQICEGNNATFNVSATGTSLNYQWRKNGVDLTDDGRITGSQTNTLEINNAILSDQAVYSCNITATCGSTNSLPANLTVNPQTVITTQPVIFEAVENGNATFSVTAVGTGLTYQWYKDGTVLTNDAIYSGVTTSILTLTNVTSANAGSYYCVVNGSCGSVTSNPGILKVNLLTLISVHPAGPVTKCVNESVSFDVVASGTNLTYQWKKDGSDLSDDGRITGTNTPNLNIDYVITGDEGSYSCLVTGDEGVENSFPANLSVNALTDITLQPLNASRCENDDAVFVINADGNITSYQWRREGVDLTDDGRITGSTTGVLEIANLAVADSGVYTCYVEGVCANDVSNPATLEVSPNTVITNQPLTKTRCAGTSATFSVEAQGGNLLYQWKKDGISLTNDGHISGANSPDLAISSVAMADQGVYTCLVSGSCGVENSASATLTVSPATTITTQPVDQSHCEGDDAFFIVDAEGLNLTYEWRKDGTVLADDAHRSGTTSNTLSITDLIPADEGTYQVFISGTCGTYLSDPTDLAISDKINIVTQPSGGTKCAEESMTLSVITSDPTNTYKWKKDGVLLTEGGHYSGTNTAFLTISDMNQSDAGVYSCLVSGPCNSMNTDLAAVAVLPETKIIVQPVSQNADIGNPVSFTVSASGDNLTYQWIKDGVTLSDNADISGSSSEVLTISNVSAADAGSYTVIVSGTCDNSISEPAVLTVNTPTVITSQPVSQVLCEGQAALLTVSATGSNLSYQWLKNGMPVNDVFGRITGSQTQNLSVSSVDSTDNGVYTCRVTGSGGVLNSGTATITVHETTRLISQPVSSQLKCAGVNTYYTVSAAGDNLSFSWEKDGAVLSNGGNISGAQSDILTVGTVSTPDAGIYRCFISGTCGDVSTDPSTLVIRELPGTPGPVSGDDLICQGETTKAYEVTTINNAESYEWTLPYGVQIVNGAGSRYIVTDYAPDALGGNISVHGRNGCGIGPESAPLNVTVNPKPVANAGFDQNLCDNTTTLGANNTTGGTWSRVTGFASFSNPNQYNTSVSNLGQGANVLVWTVTQNSCTSRDTVVIVNNMVNVDAGQDQVLCGLTTTLDASQVTKGIGQWSIKSGGANFVNFNNPKTEVINIQRGSNVLKWSVNNNGCVSSDTVVITNDLPTNAIAGSDTIILADTYTLAANTPAIGVGQWSLVSGVGVIQNPGSPTSTITNLGIGENTLKWTITNNSCYSEDELKVINYTPTVNDAGPDQTLCEDYTILAGTPPNYGTGQWTIVQGSGSFANASKYDTEIYNLGKGVNIFRWTIYEYAVTFDDVKIINNSPSSANAGIDQRLCSSSSILSANQPVVGTGKWTISGGSAVIEDENAFSTQVTDLSYGSNTFRWTISNGTCSSSDEITVINDEPTPASAGVDQTTCADSVTLYPNTPSVGTGEWSVINGSGYFVGNKAYGLGIDDNYFKWTISHNGCKSSDTVVVTSHKPTAAFLIPSKSICTDSIVLPGNAPQYGTGLWSILSGSADISNPSDPNALASNLAPGMNKFRWTITYQECTSAAEINIGYDLIKANAGVDQELCDNVAIMSANTPLPGNGLWTIVGGSGSADFANPDQPNTQVSNLDKGNNILRWTITNNGCTSYDEVTITNNNPSTAYAGADRSVCGESFSLNANNPLIGVGEWSVLSGSANITDPDMYNSRVNNLSLGKNTLRWTVTNENCSSSDEVIIYNDQPTNVSAGTDQYICGDSTQLYSSEAVDGFGRWSIAAGSASFTDNTLFNTSVLNLERGENKLVWTVTIKGCSNSDTVLVTNNLPSLPSAGPDQDNCASETFMAANIPLIGTGKWSVVSGSALFDDPSSPLTSITNVGNGTNLLRWKITNGNCSLYDDVNIINSLPTVAYAGEDRAVCNTSANLLANPPTTGTGTWKVVSGFGVIEDAHDYNTQIDNLGFGQNTIRWITENGRCRTSDDVIITNNLAEVFAGPDEIVYSPNITLVGNKPASGVGEWRLVAGTGDIDNPGSYETHVVNLGEGANTFNWTINNKGCIASDDVIITYYVLPQVDFVPTPQSGCPPLTVDFINGSVGGNPFTWDFGDGAVSSETNPMHTYTAPGEYKVTLTGTGPDGIMITRDTMVIVREKPDAQMEVTPNLVYISNPPDNLDSPVHFFTLTTDVDSVIWDFGDGTFSNEKNPLHRYQQTGIYDINLQVFTGYQCFDSEALLDAVTVEQKGSIHCPNAFTPNLEGPAGGVISPNDYSNDVFHCYADGILEYHLTIYNRLGIKLFESDDVNVGWDGYFQGKLAEEGVYVYHVSGKYNNGEEFSKIGSVVLLHE